MFLLIDNTYSGPFEDKVKGIWEEEADAVGYSLKYPDYEKYGLTMYIINSEQGVKRIEPWKALEE